MKNWTGTVSKTARAFVACALAFLAFSAGAATVRDIGIKTHYPWNGLVDVTYAVDGIAPGSSYHVTAKLVAGGQTWCTYATNVHANAGYAFQWDVTAAGFRGRAEDAQVVFTIDEPNFAVIDLSEGPTATKYPVAYINCQSIDETFIRTNEAFKTDLLLLKRVGANYVGVFEVTQRQFERVMGENPSYFSLLKDSDDIPDAAAVEAKRPVERVSYEKIAESGGFFDLLCERTGLKLALPTEDEWTTAAKGSMPDDRYYNLGAANYKTITGKKTDNTWLPSMGRYVDLWKDGVKTANGNNNPNQYTDATKGTAIVGSYNANDLGLYDMHGNVAEWTLQDVKGNKVLRGGSWLSHDFECAVTSRWVYLTGDANSLYKAGFRVFGAEPDESFEHKVVAESVVFAIDVAHWPYGGEDYAAALTNVRYMTVADFATEENKKNYEFTYWTNNVWETARRFEGGSRPWVGFDDGDKTWRPTQLGLNIVTYGAEQAMFYVKDLPWEGIETNNVAELVYDADWHDRYITITKPATNYKIEYGESEDDITLTEPPKYIDVGTYTVWYKISSLEPGAFYKPVVGTYQLKITERSVKGAVVTLENVDIRFTGLVQTQKVAKVELGFKRLDGLYTNVTLEADLEYYVANNTGTDAKTYTLKVCGTGNYKDYTNKDWEICPINLRKEPGEGGSGAYADEFKPADGVKVNTLSDTHVFYYNGHPQTNYIFSVSIVDKEFYPGSASFTELEDSVSVATDVGVYTNHIKGVKNFQGEIKKIWEIKPLTIATNSTVWLDSEFDYNGDCQTRNVTNVTVVTLGYPVEFTDPATPAIEVPSYTIDVPAAWYYVRGNTGTNASAKVGPYTLGVWAKSREGNNFCGHVYTNWFIGQRDLTNAVFTLDDAAAYDYVYNRTGKTPNATAVDAIDDGTHAINPMISPSTNLVADLTNDWKIAEYLGNVNVGDEAKVVFAATENGNYRGIVTNAFETGVMPATITSVTITNAAAKSFVYDGTEKVVHRGDVLVTTANGLTLRNDAKPYEFKTSGQNKATATGRYKVTVTPQTDNFINSHPDTAYDTWDIVPASPELTWTTLVGATNVTGEAGTFVYGVKDLTVAAFARCAGETNIFEFVTPSGTQPIVKDDKFHVTERTTIKVFSVYTAGDGTVLTGAATVVTLAPGVCADPEIFIGTPGTTAFDRNETVVTIRPSTNVNHVAVGTGDLLWPAWTNTVGTLKYWLLDATNGVIAAAGTNEYVITDAAPACTNLKVSAGTVSVVAQICDTNYLDSIVVTTKLTRTIGYLPTPVITVVTNSTGSRTVSIACDTAAPNCEIYYTTNTAAAAAPDAVIPAGPMEISRPQADRDATVKYTGKFDISLAKDEALDIKAIAYLVVTGENDFTNRSAVAEARDVREWTIGDALDCVDQPFTNGWSQVPVPKFASDDPKADPVDFVSNDVPWFVFKDKDAVGGECMRSGILTNGNFRTSSISTTVKGAGLVVFHWKANCESDPSGRCEWDHGEFIVDGVVITNIDGKTDWQRAEAWVDNSGDHTVTWTYVKDFAKQGGVAAGEDCIYLDNFTFHEGSRFGEASVTIKVDPLVFNGDFQLPTGQTATAVLPATNYVHATIKYPETGNDYELIEGRDYEVTATKHRAVGTFANDLHLAATPSSILVGGETNLSWTIVPMDISNAVVECVSTNLAYTGSTMQPTVSHVWVKHDRAADPIDLVKWSNSYTMTDTNGLDVAKKEAGDYKFQLVGGLNMTNTTAAFDWTISKTGFDGVTITIDPAEFTYDRTNQQPTVTLTYNETGNKLVKGVDYDYTWPVDCSNAGTKAFVLVGLGSFEGTTSNVSYKINKAVVNRIDLNEDPPSFLYDSTEKSVTGRAFAGEIELTAEEWAITNNVATNAATYAAGVTLTALGEANFGITVPAPTTNWVINPIDIGAPETELVALPTVKFVYDATDKQVTKECLTNVTANGLALDTNKIVIVCTPQSAKGTYSYTLKPGAEDSNFTGETNLVWKITPPPFDSITLDNELTWNGVCETQVDGQRFKRVIVVEPSDQTQKVVVVANGLTLTENVDYVLSNNVDKVAGKHTLTVYGINNFDGVESDPVVWTIKPSKVTITPNVTNPTEMEEFFSKGTGRISMLADVEGWRCRFTTNYFEKGVAQEPCDEKTFRTIVIRRRTVVTGWAVTSDGVVGDKISVDYKMGFAAKPVSVLQDMNALPAYKLPVYDDSGLATTNDVTGLQEPTNFWYNGQKIVLTRGNVKSDGALIRDPETNTNYLDGVIVYTLDGTEPVYTNGVLVGSTMIWTDGVSEIATSETITNIVKVCGYEYFDSPSVTNVFVRTSGTYATPIISFKTNETGFVVAPDEVKITTVPYLIKLARADDLPYGQIAYTADGGLTTNVFDDAEVIIQTNRAVTITAWVQVKAGCEGQILPSEPKTSKFTTGDPLKVPTIEFNTNVVAVAQYQDFANNAFSNKMQYIDFKRTGTSVYDTDGRIWYSISNATLGAWTDWAPTNATPLAIWETTWVKAQVKESAFGLRDSDIVEVKFTQAPAPVETPTVTFSETPTVKQVTISLASTDANAIYYTYTTDGTEPTDPVGINEGAPSAKYTEPFTVSISLDAPVKVKAIAYKEDGNGDFYGRSAIGVGEKVRVETVMDAIKPDDPAKLGPDDQPDTSDLPHFNDPNTWTDIHGQVFTNAWFKDETEAVYPGGYSLRSGKLRSGDVGEVERISTLTATVMGPGKVSFQWKSDTEFIDDFPEFDFGTFYVDGVVVKQIWGSNDWSEVSFVIDETTENAQPHELKWTYEKDWDDDPAYEGEDCIWVDELVWAPAADMKQLEVTVGDLTYNKTPQVPTFTVCDTNSGTSVTLVEGMHYTIEIAPQTDAATNYVYTLHATGKGYTGAVSGTWTIKPLSLDGATVKLTDGQMFRREYISGNAIGQFAIVTNITVGGLDVTDVATWKASGTNEIYAGDYTATVTGSSNLTGSASAAWKILPRPLDASMVTFANGTDESEQLVYSGSETNVAFGLHYGGEGGGSASTRWLGRGTDYTVDVGSDIATNAGTYKVAVNGQGNYSGSVTQEWKIVKFDFDTYASTPELNTSHFPYTGAPHTVDVVRVIGAHPYWGNISFSNTNEWIVSGTTVAQEKGTNWVFVTAKVDSENFTGGPISNRWTIGGVPFENVTVVLGPTNTFTGSVLTQTIESVTVEGIVGELRPGIDYTVSGNSQTNAGHYTMRLTGKEDFEGQSVDVAYEVLPAPITDTVITFTDYPGVYTGANQAPKITMMLGDFEVKPNVLIEGENIGGYVLDDAQSVTNALAAGEYKVVFSNCYDKTRATYTGNLAGTTNVSWTILQRDMKTLSVTQTPDTFVYNRAAQKPTVAVKCGDVTLAEGADKDYVIEWPSDCTSASNAIEYVVKGTGVNVTNEVKMSYAITPAEITEMKFKTTLGDKLELVFNDANQSVKPASVKAGDLTLDATEYAISNSNGTDVAEYTSVVRSISPNFADPSSEISDKWWITAKPITEGEVVVSFAKTIYYTGANQEITAGDVTQVTCAGIVMKSGEYSFAANPQVNVASYWTKMTASGNFTGEKDVEWNIEARDITEAKAIEFEKDRLEWTGSELTPVIKSITVPDVNGGADLVFTGTLLAGLTVNNAQTEAGFYKSTISGTGNFTGTTKLEQSWGIVPGTPKITPNDGAGTYTKLADFIPVEINNSPDTAPWQIFYTTNDWAETKPYALKGGKFDITRHTVVKAYAVSLDNCITGETATCEYFFGNRNRAPTIGLTALAGAEEGRPASYEGTEVKGEAKLVVKGTDTVTNFYHSGTKVFLTRFGTMNTDEIAQAIEDTKTAQGDSPLTDGKIYYTIAEGEDATVYAPDTNDTVNTKWFNPDDNTTWPTFSTNAVIVAQVFGENLESSKPVTNAFQRLFAQIPEPTIKPDDLDFHFSLTNSIVTNAYVGADWTVTNELQKIYVTLDETDPTASATRFLYTNEFEVTWANTNAAGKVVVKAVATREGEGYQNSSVVTKEYQFLTDRFSAPTMTPATTFRHWKPEDTSKPDGFQVFITNNAPLGVGGKLMYSINGVEYPTPGDVETYSDIYLKNTSTVCVWVATTDAAHDYKPSLTNETIYTYKPYKMVAPTNDTPSCVFSKDEIEFTISKVAEDPTVEDYEHIYHGTLQYSFNQGLGWTTATGDSQTFKTNETVEIWIKQVDLEGDHLDSDIVSNVYSRSVVAPVIKLLKWDGDELAETNIVAGVTNFYHNSRLQIIHPIGTTLTYTSDIPGYESGTYTGPIPVKDTFTLTAKATTQGGSVSEEITVHYNRVWDTLAKAKVELVRPQDGVLTNEFRNTADRLAITNGLADVESRIVLWPTNVVVKYAVVPNSADTETFPTAATFNEFEQGVTKQYFKADTNVVWAIATAEDYQPSTNAVKFIRSLDPIEKPTVAFDNSVNRTNVTVTIGGPAGATIYYTCAITNVAADVADPVGDEYDYTKCTNKYDGAFDVVLKPDETLVVKARAYFEDGTSSFVEGFTETNFTARSEVACEAFTLPWTIGDALDAPDQEFVAYDSIEKASNTNVVEDTAVKNFGTSSMVIKALEDGEWASIETKVTGPGTLIFDWKTRCELKQQAWRDHFAFELDGDVRLRIDGDTDWTTVTNYIGGFIGQEHTLTWRYRKDASEKQLDDSAWLDHFRWIPSEDGIEIDDELEDWLQATAGSDYWTVLCPGGVYNYKNCTDYLAQTADNGRSFYDCYVLGLAVDDPDSEFKAVNPVFVYEDDPRNPGQQVMTRVTISWTPITMPNRVYSLVGMKELTDEAWTILNEKTFDVPAAGSTEEADRKISATTSYIEGYHFFEIRVRMAK